VAYVATLAPGLTYEHYGTDGGDLVSAAWTLGIPHPTGYPTYTLLGWLFSQLSIGTVAYRLNLLSAVCAAAAVGMLFNISRRLLPAKDHPLIISGATALILGFSSLLWSQAVISEVYALLTFFAVLLLALLVRWRQGGSDWCLWLAGLTLGLGLGNHLTLVAAAPAALVLLWPERRRWFRIRVLLPGITLFFLGLGIYAYLPLAAVHSPPINWGNVQTWDRFLWVVTGKQYQAFAFGLDPEMAPLRVGAWAILLGDQFGWWGLIPVLAGIGWWWQRDRQFVLFSLAWMLPLGLYAFFYDTPDSHIYMLPAIALLALFWGEGVRRLAHLSQGLRTHWRRLVLVLIALLPLASAAIHWRTADLSGDWQVHEYIGQALQNVAPNGLVVVRGDRPTFALWYGVYVEDIFGEKQRTDIAVVNAPMLAFIWYREHVRHLYPDLNLREPTIHDDVTTDDLARELIINNLGLRPIYATDPKEQWGARLDFVQDAGSPIYRVRLKTIWEAEG
jgi:4-amino-4-deoxy-L-arabinose transferase-like glycosyltransferase